MQEYESEMVNIVKWKRKELFYPQCEFFFFLIFGNFTFQCPISCDRAVKFHLLRPLDVMNCDLWML